MKTLIYSLLSFVFALSTFAAKAVSIPPTDGLGPKIKIGVEFGRKSKGCARIGICRITFEGIEQQAGPNGENTASGTAWIENGKLKIDFNRASMTDATFQTHFGNGNFQLEEDYVLPAEVASALGVRSYIVRTGKYLLPQSNGESSNLPVTF